MNTKSNRNTKSRRSTNKIPLSWKLSVIELFFERGMPIDAIIYSDYRVSDRGIEFLSVSEVEGIIRDSVNGKLRRCDKKRKIERDSFYR